MTFDLDYPTSIYDVHNLDDDSTDVVLLQVNSFSAMVNDPEFAGDGVGFPVLDDHVNMDFPIIPESIHTLPYTCTHILWFPQ